MSVDPLQQPREEIDNIDAKIIGLLGDRWKLVEQVSQIKHKHNLPPLQPERFNDLLSEMKRLGRENGIPEAMVEEIWHSIHKHSRRSQGEVDAN